MPKQSETYSAGAMRAARDLHYWNSDCDVVDCKHDLISLAETISRETHDLELLEALHEMVCVMRRNPKGPAIELLESVEQCEAEIQKATGGDLKAREHEAAK